jgi:peptidoglycan-N-acetylglucosamine deacetylase
MNAGIASLSLDLDNQWTYMKTHGDPGWESYPSYLDLVVPRVLSFLKERNLTVTVFIVGQDAALEKNKGALSAIATAGHEIGNHSFRHEPWLHRYTEAEIEADIAAAEEHIERVTGKRPIGFRGPGFALSHAILQVLARRGYRYDASTLPTFLGPVARAYYFMSTKLGEEERIQRKALFGTFRDGLRPIRPYRWRLNPGTLIEIPVTTMPILKVPIHVSYLLYLSVVSPALAMHYFKMALALCRFTGTQPSLLLHPLDFLGGEEVPELSFFPAMGLSVDRKMELVREVIRIYSSRYTVGTLQQHASEISRTARLPSMESRFIEQKSVGKS